jgi:hypothetical protein
MAPTRAWASTCGVIALLVLVLGAPSIVMAHPGMSHEQSAAADPGAAGFWAAVAPVMPVLAAAAALALAILASSPAGRRAGRRRPLRVALSLLLVVFACETTLHSAHHLNDPRRAEHCAVYSASLHLSGLEASPATPELARPVASLDAVCLHEGQPSARTLDGPSSRAPPALSA